MKIRPLLLIAFLVVLATCNSGCYGIYVSTRRLPEETGATWSRLDVNKPAIARTFEIESFERTNSGDLKEAPLDEGSIATIDDVVHSTRLVGDGPLNSKIVITVVEESWIDGLDSQILGAVTLALYPMTLIREYTVSAEYVLDNRSVSKQSEQSSINATVQMFLLFALPWYDYQLEDRHLRRLTGIVLGKLGQGIDAMQRLKMSDKDVVKSLDQAHKK